jgi:hypothetical protein
VAHDIIIQAVVDGSTVAATNSISVEVRERLSIAKPGGTRIVVAS